MVDEEMREKVSMVRIRLVLSDVSALLRQVQMSVKMVDERTMMVEL